jgi:glycosyltransferase involved in cell wall biosynthesis
MPGVRVAIDAVGISGGGGLEVARDLVEACLSEDEGVSLCLYVSDAVLNAAFTNRDRVHTRHVPSTYVNRLQWWLWGCNRSMARDRCGAILHLGNVALRRPPQGKSAVLVHQANVFRADIPCRHSWLAQIRYKVLYGLVAWTCRRVDQIFVQSHRLRQQLMQSMSVRAPVCVALPSPPASLIRGVGEHTHASAAGTGSYVAYVGSMAPHKNLDVLLAAALRPAEDTFELRLTVDRPRSWKDIDLERVHFLGTLGREDVYDLINGARALVMPSLTESVGLPMLEAMSLSVPVIAADRSYARDLCGRAAVYFDPNDPNDLHRVCLEVLRSEKLRTQLVAAGRHRISELNQARGDRKIARWLILAGRDVRRSDN